MVQLLSIILPSVTVIVSQRIGYLALVKKLDAKADKKETDERFKVLEDAHGGVLR